MKKHFLSLALAGMALIGHAQLHVTGLRTEHLQNPSVIDTPQPRFSWINEARKGKVGQRQTAYEIAVASSPDMLDKGIYDVWQSGRQVSAESVLVPYGGPALEDGRDYYWKVRTTDQDGRVSRWSEPARWGMGLTKWESRWIAGSNAGQEGILLRRAFQTNKAIRQAKAFVCGLGFFELYLNDSKVGEDLLVPNISNYGRRPELPDFGISLDPDFRDYRCLYLAYDITAQLHEGRNMLGVMLGTGWFRPDSGRACGFGQPCLRAELHITYQDGTKETILTDGSWETRLSPITYGGIYGGELYDARLDIADWCLPDSESKGWTPANVIDGPIGQMSAMASPADKVTRILKPISFNKVGDRRYEVDFGQEISGWIHFRHLCGTRGDTLCCTFACESPQGQERYIFGGQGDESYRPHFSWYVFSKATITGIDSLTASQLVAECVNTDVPVTAEFHTSNPLLNRINEIWQHSQIDNMHGCIASDCPHRERLPYTGDGQAASEMVMLSFDAAAFYAKWIRDMRDSQNRVTGHVPNAAPWQPGAGGGVAWGAAMTLIPWWFYEQYGDRRLLEESYFAMKEQVRYMLSWVTLDGIMEQQMRGFGRGELCYWFNLGDWVPPHEMPRDPLVHTFFLWQCLDHCARAARTLGLEQEAEHYRELTDKARANFHRVFYDPQEKSYGKGGSNVYALRMGVPEEHRQDVINTLRREIMLDNDSCLNTGFVATKYLFETLTDCGLGDVALAVMNQRKQPSYGWWIDQGATVTWEQWDGANSHNHPMFGGGLTWFYRRLCGIQADQPGYRHVTIRPMQTDLEEVSCALRTPYGRLSVSITQKGSRTITVTIPVGTTAMLCLPDDEQELAQGTYTFTR